MKRFTETEKWRDPWFRKLSPIQKNLFEYMRDQCDGAGVIDLDLDLAGFLIGTNITETLLEGFGNRIERLPCGKVWLTKFIEFQYGELSEKCKPHLHVIRLLKTHDLLERVSKGFAKGLPTLEEKEKEKEKEKKKDKKEGVGENNFELFWKAYPLKKAKGDAIKAWKKHECELIAGHIMAKLELLKQDFRWIKEDGKYIPYPATWLNRMGWEDEIKSTEPKEKQWITK